jgi:uncharacterized membrane protein
MDTNSMLQELWNNLLPAIFRWSHIVAGILWIGLLWFFNFVNIPFQGTIDMDTKKKVNPEMLGRTLFFFRWAALWTWTFGVLMLIWVYYMSSLMFDAGTAAWTGGSYVMIALILVAPFIYDALAKALGKNWQMWAVVAFVLTMATVCGFIYVGGFGYRAYVIHTGALFGTIMAFNVWFKIWPAQQKVLGGMRSGTPADPSYAALAGARSKHNTYMSVPLVWCMINAHTAAPAASSPAYLAGVILIGWGFVFWMYKKAAKVKGL